MVRVIGPMHSEDARGKFGNSMVFSARRGTNFVRVNRPQKKSQTTSQLLRREIFTEGVTAWRDGTVDAGDKTDWATEAEGTAETGFNRFMRFYLNVNFNSGTGEKVTPQVIPEPQ